MYVITVNDFRSVVQLDLEVPLNQRLKITMILITLGRKNLYIALSPGIALSNWILMVRIALMSAGSKSGSSF